MLEFTDFLDVDIDLRDLDVERLGKLIGNLRLDFGDNFADLHAVGENDEHVDAVGISFFLPHDDAILRFFLLQKEVDLIAQKRLLGAEPDHAENIAERILDDRRQRVQTRRNLSVFRFGINRHKTAFLKYKNPRTKNSS